MPSCNISHSGFDLIDPICGFYLPELTSTDSFLEEINMEKKNDLHVLQEMSSPDFLTDDFPIIALPEVTIHLDNNPTRIENSNSMLSNTSMSEQISVATNSYETPEISSSPSSFFDLRSNFVHNTPIVVSSSPEKAYAIQMQEEGKNFRTQSEMAKTSTTANFQSTNECVYPSKTLIHGEDTQCMEMQLDPTLRKKTSEDTALIDQLPKEDSIPLLLETPNEEDQTATTSVFSTVVETLSKFSDEEFGPDVNMEVTKEFPNLFVDPLAGETLNGVFVDETLNSDLNFETESNNRHFIQSDSNPLMGVAQSYDSSNLCTFYPSAPPSSYSSLWNAPMNTDRSCFIPRIANTSRWESPLMFKPVLGTAHPAELAHIHPESTSPIINPSAFPSTPYPKAGVPRPPFSYNYEQNTFFSGSLSPSFLPPEIHDLDQIMNSTLNTFASSLDEIRKDEGLFEVLTAFQRGGNKFDPVLNPTSSIISSNVSSTLFGRVQIGSSEGASLSHFGIEPQTSALIPKQNVSHALPQKQISGRDHGGKAQITADGMEPSLNQSPSEQVQPLGQIQMLSKEVQEPLEKRIKVDTSGDLCVARTSQMNNTQNSLLAFSQTKPNNAEKASPTGSIDSKAQNTSDKSANITAPEPDKSSTNDVNKTEKDQQPFLIPSNTSKNLKRKYTKLSSPKEAKPKQMELKIRKEGVAERITLLRQLVAPHLLKGDTSTVLGLAVDCLRQLYKEISDKLGIDQENISKMDENETDHSPKLTLRQKNVDLFPVSLLQWSVKQMKKLP